MMSAKRFFMFLTAVTAGQILCASPSTKKIDAKELSRGPLNLSADETISKDHGRIIESAGHVKVKYLMENGDTLESSSGFAKYDHELSLGEVWGNPDAYWFRSKSSEPATRLLAQKITLKIKDSELFATGNVSVIQASSTLTAEKISYSNLEKKLTAIEGNPEFNIAQANHKTRISAQTIEAFTEKKEIHFAGKVHGRVLLKDEKPQ